MSDRSDHLDSLSEAEVLARLTVAEKRRVARSAILEFPHLDHAMVDEWLQANGVNTIGPEASLPEKVDALLDRCETLVRAGEDRAALDRFISGYLYPAHLELCGVDPETVADREPLAVWDPADAAE